jgi:hypothetical protein
LQKNKPQLYEWNRLCVLEIKQAIHGFKTTSPDLFEIPSVGFTSLLCSLQREIKR